MCTFILSVSVFHNVTARVSQIFSVRRVEAGKREKSIKVYFNESFSFLLLGDIYARGGGSGGGAICQANYIYIVLRKI